MFKGLKSKLEDEAKKLQASVQQYSEQFTQQVEQIRHGTSDAGSESGSSITRRFLNTVGTTSSPGPHNVQDSINLSVGDTLMEEVTEGDLLGLELSSRQRRLSGGSSYSTESSLSTLFQSVPGLAGTTLDTADSDNETLDEYSSGVIKTASKDQISNVLSRLQGRATSYKDKYRDLVKKYNEVVTENNKCRTVLAQTQDKALERIEKLRNEKKALGERLREIEESRSSASPVGQKIHKYEEMLEKCKAEITKNRAKIKELTQENEKLLHSVQAAEGESDISNLVVDRVTNEWKQRIDKVEEEWTARMNKNDEDHAIQLATAKAEMHAALETKDREIESWRSKCHSLEFQDGQANERWQKKVDELQQIIQALDVEKSDMIEKLSAAKQQGVKAVRDEEEKKREDLLAEFEAKEKKLNEEFTVKLNELETSKDEEIEKLKSDLESTRNSENSFKEARDHEDALAKELESLQRQVEELDEKNRREVSELKESMALTIENHRAEVAELIREHDEIVASVKQQQEIELNSARARFEQTREEADGLRLKNEALEKQLEDLDETYHEEKNQIEKLHQLLEQLQKESESRKSAQQSQTDSQMAELRDSYSKLLESNDTLRMKLETLQKETSENLEEARQKEEAVRAELEDVRSMLESRNAEFHLMEIRKEELEAELATARELAEMHKHMKAELEQAKKQRNDIEAMVAALKERAEKAEKALEEDRARLLEDQQALEKSVEERKEQKEIEIPLSSEPEVKKVVINDELASLIDLTSSTAVEMSVSDELQQLRAEIEHLNNVNEQLSARIQLLEVEKSSTENTQEEQMQQLVDLSSSGSYFDKSAVFDKLEKLEAETYDVVMNMSENAEMENTRLNKELEKNMAEIEKAREQKEALEQELRELKAQFAALHPNVSEAEMMSHVEDHISGGQGDQEANVKSTLEEELERVRSSLNDVKQRHDIEIERLSEQIRQLTAEKDAAESRRSETEQQIASVEDHVRALNEEIKQLNEMVTFEKGRAEEAVEAVKVKTAEYEQQSAALLGDLKEKVDSTVKLEEELEEIKKKEEDARSNLQISEEKYTQLEIRLNRLTVELEKANESLAEERAHGSEITHLKNGMERQIEELNSQLKAAEEKLVAKEQELEAVKSSQAESASTITKLETYVEDLKRQLEENQRKAAEDTDRSTASLEKLKESLLVEEKRTLELLEQLKAEQAEVKRKVKKAREEAREEQASPMAAKIRELEEVNDKMRVEFIAKENVIKELRAEIEQIQTQREESARVDGQKLKAAEDQIAHLKAEGEKASNSITEVKAKLLVAEEKLRDVEIVREKEKAEEERIRDQYASALENLKTELAEAHKRLKVTESAETKCEKLKMELEKVKKQAEEDGAKQKEESESALQELKAKAEKKLAKIKANAEKEVTSAKAELLLEMDELRRNLSDRDRRIDELVVEKARMEQQIIGQQEMEKELEQRRTKEKELTDFRKNTERRLVELEADNKLLSERNAELNEQKEQSAARAEQSERTVKELQDKIKFLEDANEEGFRKAAAKSESDSKKAVRELQREVKQLYVELNEKTDALDTAHARIAELESSSKEDEESIAEKQTQQVVDASPNYEYEEELESMRNRLKESHKEVDSLREANARLEQMMEQQYKSHVNTPAVIHVNGGDCVGFADPAEAEYLKNVLYRYMYSRENLGKEAVTLARVIGTVAKFSKSEMENVITREESRVAGWVGGTVSHVLTGR